MANSCKILSTIMTLTSIACQPAFSQSIDHKLGKVHFETSCTPEAAAAFDRGMLFQHSFWYSASQRAFNEAVKADPSCGIAYWGIALSLLWNPHVVPSARNLAEGAVILARGREIGAKTERERDYLSALSAMYTDHDKVDHRTRVLNYLKEMEQLAVKYPDDDEAQIYYSLALNVGASPVDKTYANQLKGAAILERIWNRQPDHPGIAHYLIHLYDTPALAAKGILAAQRYAKVAPDAPHAQHMPSHIFTRVGAWQESIESNAASAQSAKAANEGADQLHAMDYQVYSYLQLGEDDQAKRVIEEMVKVVGFSEVVQTGPYALAASPARYVVERGDWKSAANLEVRLTSVPHAMAISWFAKGLGAARTGDSTQAQAAIAQLAASRDQLKTKKDAYWAEQVDIQAQIVKAWTLFGEGQEDPALTIMREAADAEDRTEKAPVTPGNLLPARELYGAMLLQRDDAKGALAAFEATMQKEPNRLNAILGAAQAALASGDSARARQYYSTALGLASNTSITRPEVVEARAYLARAK